MFSREQDFDKDIYVVTLSDDSVSYELKLKFAQVKGMFSNHSDQFMAAEFRSIFAKKPVLFKRLIDSIDFSPSTGHLHMDINHF